MPYTWNDIITPEREEGGLWELFHENSKTTAWDRPLSSQEVSARMSAMWPSLPYEGYPATDLPEPGHLGMALSEAIRRRITARNLQGCSVTLAQIGTMLFHSYGETRLNTDTGYPRPFRVIPSGGGLFPLEIYFHTCRTDDLAPGLYHYNPNQKQVRQLREGDLSHRISAGFVQPELVMNSAFQVFVTAMFERSVFKYRIAAIGSRSWRLATSPRTSISPPPPWALASLMWAASLTVFSTMSSSWMA